MQLRQVFGNDDVAMQAVVFKQTVVRSAVGLLSIHILCPELIHQGVDREIKIASNDCSLRLLFSQLTTSSRTCAP